MAPNLVQSCEFQVTLTPTISTRQVQFNQEDKVSSWEVYYFHPSKGWYVQTQDCPSTQDKQALQTQKGTLFTTFTIHF